MTVTKKTAGILDFGRISHGPASCDFAYFVTMPADVYQQVIDSYNAKSAKPLDPNQPLFYSAAIYARSYLQAADGQGLPPPSGARAEAAETGHGKNPA